LITAHDMSMSAARPLQSPAATSQAVPFRERILLLTLFVTVLTSSIAFIEPSPYDVLMGVLAVACLAAGVRFERKIAPLILLLVVWNVAGLMALLNVPSEQPAIQYAATSVYLAVAAILFACLFAENTMLRLTAMRSAYVLTAVVAALIGTAGYFHLFPGFDMFAPFGRALGAFKDPNVFGPFLIWPALFLLERMLSRRIGVLDLAAATILLFGLLLSFSRGAWFHFAVSSVVLLAMAFLTAPSQRARLRVFGLSATGILALAGLLVVLLSIPAIGQMFAERAQLIQSYDVGEGGRFRLQELALSSVLNFPNGMGPFEFARVHGLQQHNVYLQAFLVYGWAGAMAYLMLLVATLFVGFRASLMRTPWQPYVITTFAAFVGEVAEGFVIDTDHWRHFYLLLGIIWGLSAASLRRARQAQTMTPAAWTRGRLA
jgi:hypothetical protein